LIFKKIIIITFNLNTDILISINLYLFYEYPEGKLNLSRVAMNLLTANTSFLKLLCSSKSMKSSQKGIIEAFSCTLTCHQHIYEYAMKKPGQHTVLLQYHIFYRKNNLEPWTLCEDCYIQKGKLTMEKINPILFYAQWSFGP
jgi:hypothetical protein